MMSDFDVALTELVDTIDGMKPVSVTGTLADIVYTIPMGCDALNVQINGGLPGGRITEIYGPKSSGKSLLALQAIANCQEQMGIALYLDVEGTTDAAFMEKLGVRTDRIYVSNPDTIEDVRKDIEEFIQYKAEIESKLKANKVIEKDQIIPAIIVWDSVAATTSSAAADKVGDEGLDSVTVATQARQMSALFRDGRIHKKLNEAGVTLLVINQQRYKIGQLWGDNKSTYGGEALPYYTSVRIELKERTVLKINKEEAGIMVRAKVTKSKVGTPFGEVKLCMLFNQGVHNALTTFYTLEDMGLIGKSGSWLVLQLDEEYKFRRSEFATVINDHYDQVLDLLRKHGPNREGVEIPEATVEETDDTLTS